VQSLQQRLTTIVSEAFASLGLRPVLGAVTPSGAQGPYQYQCNGAFSAADAVTLPNVIAQRVVDRLKDQPCFERVEVSGKGFISMTLNPEFVATVLREMRENLKFGLELPTFTQPIVLDYGGPNVAKPMHVGHLRSAVIGQCLKHLARFIGATVIGDIHMGDWGTQMGMIIEELKLRHPELTYFDESYTGEYPEESPVTIDDLQEIYPVASKRCKDSEEAMEAARKATYELQQGRRGYRTLWKHFVDVSVDEMRADFGVLGIDFEYWFGESDAHHLVPGMVAELQEKGIAYRSEGALVIDVADENDKMGIPPMILLKSDGAELYATTDLATIKQRMTDFNPGLIAYVVDERQSTHFEQVFRAAYKTGIAPMSTQLQHIGFGTVNGKDGKPFKTRAGGVMRLKDLISMLENKARDRVAEVIKDRTTEIPAGEQREVARLVSLAALKFGDLINDRKRNYIFDLDRFTSFDGRTGPYLLYTAVRIKSLLRKADEQSLSLGTLVKPSTSTELVLMLHLSGLQEAIDRSWNSFAPHHLAEYTHELALYFTHFYEETRILTEADEERRGSWLCLSILTLNILTQCLSIMGMEVPERM